ncbi:hypothetical protein Pcinc_008513 [Petrolisthes cinctipes]|uniref:BolA-like protein 3 n=1 Tax=Petrolisthes cinctipes TaxID=88211 RepID=A0AAE1G8S1_PETCI|nr:hypothetical protein Pcinc_008513 [Petrolisthes cinctipes]
MRSVLQSGRALTRLIISSRRTQGGSMMGVQGLCDAGGEVQLSSILRQSFPEASQVEVQDISGGCGAMYEIWVEDKTFKGLSKVKQHRLITQALKAEIQDMHGLRITTSIPEDS